MDTNSRLKRVWIPGHIFERIFADLNSIWGDVGSLFGPFFGNQNAPQNTSKKQSVFGVISGGGTPSSNRVDGMSAPPLWGHSKMAICTKKCSKTLGFSASAKSGVSEGR